MPTWTNQIPDDPRGYALPLVRTPAVGTLEAIITSTDLIGTETHFWGGHTVPCTRTDCEACERGSPYRWHAYLSAYNPKDQLHFIFECTAHAAKPLGDYRKAHKNLRGCQFQAYRWKHTRNGRVILRCKPSDLHPAILPAAPDLPRIMSIIWRLPVPNVFQAGQLRGHPRIHADPNGDGSSSDPRDYETARP